jgi:hypothetical protein
VIAAVLAEVALFPSGADFGGHGRPVRDQFVQLRGEAVMRFLGEPGGLRVAIGGGHGDLLALLTFMAIGVIARPTGGHAVT